MTNQHHDPAATPPEHGHPAGDRTSAPQQPLAPGQQPDPVGRAILELANLQSGIHGLLWRAETAGRYVPIGDYPHGTPTWKMAATDILGLLSPRLADLRRADR
jgi:hypothetical protein